MNEKFILRVVITSDLKNLKNLRNRLKIISNSQIDFFKNYFYLEKLESLGFQNFKNSDYSIFKPFLLLNINFSSLRVRELLHKCIDFLVDFFLKKMSYYNIPNFEVGGKRDLNVYVSVHL